ncbi:electron transfer flavoprotein subunit alpha/FixB family protein [Duganella sp. BJB488]|uniref:electron transfer flavoprotein subunit alpha/FixB family protein n=1 Tax=unclassified Duganella TaxID=2636909 RepID=UPI000E342188|nr:MULTISPECIES: electron transfer flavoprotein subunit alpha/FixB family protein [unclassified Duganella]RFP09285.1 electron transfer flavoprotein subunit alpha/FixB family protein [Duganella sp. BJB475]RFP13174.1 electron transfer flavoprotein subunit alpha/FixB family protein [Duganella sp. BJB489]RFP17064.1 electron transfer flavoprotein subunit alpha/FixB family protein [Duganella sp. BJB488]RFP25320.1 electron transfer flavoprotein subunit alpha/FixB family protein [Duganella sp. BJB476]
MTALVIAEHDHTGLKAATLHTISAALACCAEVHVLVAGAACADAAAAAAGIRGVAKVLLADAQHLATGAENLAEQILALAAGYSHILAPATACGKSVLPRVAARLDVAQISEASRVCTPDTFERPVYAGNVVATVQSADAIKVLTVRTTSFEPAAGGGDAVVEAVAPAANRGRSTLLSRQTVSSGRPELSGAGIVVAGGRGLGSAENFKLLDPLADRLGAAIGASRAAVDAGFVPNDWQVGQTGKIVAPRLYIAVGISGAIQHLAGMKESKTIVAINKDPEAPIFAVADYGIVGDLFEIVPQMVAALA